MAVLRLGDLTVDLDSGERSTGPPLRPIELSLLRYLAERPGEVVALDRLLVDVWGYSPRVRSRAPYSTVMRLRAAIEVDPADPRHLLSHRGAGYSLEGVERPAPPARRRVPVPATAFVGRSLPLGDGPLVTLVGPAGIGKTRRALEAVRDRADAWFCALEAARTRAEAEPLLAAAIPEAGGPALGDRLRAIAPAVLVLDNLEQVEGRAELVRACLAVDGVRVIATSRCAVGLPEERVVPVAPLDAADSVALLRQRVGLREGAELAGHEVEALLAHAEGMPLALEIIAANVALVGADAVLAQLGQGGVLRARVRGPDRHESVDAAVRWSLALLPSERIEDLCALAVLDGPFGLAAAEAALGADPFDPLTDLVDAALVTPERGPAGGRFRVLTPIRDAVRRRPEHDPGAAFDRLLGWVEREAGARRPVLSPVAPVRLPISVEAHRQLFAAVEGGDGTAERKARVVLGLAASAAHLSDHAGAAHWLRRAIGWAPSPATASDLGVLLATVDPTAVDAFPAALAAARRAGDPTRELLVSIQHAIALSRDHRRVGEVAGLLREIAAIRVPEAARATALGGVAFVRSAVKQRSNDVVGCESDLREALDRLGEADDPVVTLIHTRLAQLAMIRGDLGEASARIGIATTAPGADVARATAWAYAATVWRHAGRPADALTAARRGIDEARASAQGYLAALRMGAWTALHVGERALGLRWLEERLGLPSIGPEAQFARLIDRSVLEAVAAPDLGASLALAERAWRTAIDDFPVWAADAALWLGELRIATGDLAGAAEVLARSELAGGLPAVDATLLAAEVALRTGDPGRARAIAAAVARGAVLPVARARALGVVAIAAELDGDRPTADACLAETVGVRGSDDGWLTLHRAVVHRLRTGLAGGAPEAVEVDAGPIQLALGRLRAAFPG